MSRAFTSVGSPNEYILTSTSRPINSLAEFTVAAWIYPTSLANFGTIAWKDAPNGPRLEIGSAPGLGGQVFDSVGGNTRAFGNTPLSLNTWSHVALVFSYSGDKLCHLFINGVESSYLFVSPALSTLPKDDSAGGFIVGNDQTNSFPWNGDIAEVVEYNVALTASQVAALAASTIGATAVLPSNIVGYWHLYGTVNPEPDASGNRNVGTLSPNPPPIGPNSPGFSPPYSVTDCRKYGAFPNITNVINGTLIYDVQISNNGAVPGKDSRAAGAPVDCRVSPNIPENSRTLGTFGPGE